MNDQKVKEKPEEFSRAEQLSDEGKLDDTLTLLNNYEQKEGLTRYDKASCHLLQCQILFWQGKYKELIKLAEQAYKESEGLENNFLKVDSLFLMIHALTRFGKFDEASDLITQGEELIKTIPQELTKAYKQREASLAYLKGWFYSIRVLSIGSPNDTDLALEYLEHSLALREELGIKHEIAESLIRLGWIFSTIKFELNRALKYAERGLALAKESTKKYYIASSLKSLAELYYIKGELDRSISFYEQSMELFSKLNNKRMIANILNNVGWVYKMKGEFDRALECLEQSLALHQELGNLRDTAAIYDNLIQILIDKGDIERAQISLHDLEQLNSQLEDKEINVIYLFNKALVLKTSPRIRNLSKAEEILTQLLKEQDLHYDITLGVLLNSCELLIIELRMINDVEVLDEINPLIARLVNFAEKSNSYFILAETCFLQSKLSLLTFEIKKAQRFLTQAQQIAEKFGHNQLAVKIANEKEELLTKLDFWEKLKEEDAPMSDRMELARLDEKIVKMIQKHPVIPVQVSEEKVAISKEKKICLVCRGEVFGFSYACKCGANYCENCARALTNLENVCWACETQIDYSKPVKLFKEEEERVKVEVKPKKK